MKEPKQELFEAARDRVQTSETLRPYGPILLFGWESIKIPGFEQFDADRYLGYLASGPEGNLVEFAEGFCHQAGVDAGEMGRRLENLAGELLSYPQAAALRGVHHSVIYDAIHAGRLTPVTVAGRQVLRRADVEALSIRPNKLRQRGEASEQR
jgi:hypothetical protein